MPAYCFVLSAQSRLIGAIRKMYLMLYPGAWLSCDKGQPISPKITENLREEAGGWILGCVMAMDLFPHIMKARALVSTS